MGNSGANALQVEVQKVQMPHGSGRLDLASKSAAVTDSYSFGVSSSSYLNYREGGRIKMSDQLNHHRANLMKIAFVGGSAQVIEPEVELLSFFQKDGGKYGRIYNIISKDLFEEELKCGDLIRAGSTELLVREIVDGRERVRYKGSNGSIRLEEESILDGSVFNLEDSYVLDPNDRADRCMICGEKSPSSHSENPLIYPCPNPAVCYCRCCLNKHVKDHTTITSHTAGVMHFVVSDLFDPASGAEYLRFVAAESGTTHELISFKMFFSSAQAIILEKLQTAEKKGEVEGWILMFDSDGPCLPEAEPANFGSSKKCQIVLNDATVEPVHFSIAMNESKYFISDCNSRQYTYLRKHSKNKFDELKTSELFCLHDHIIRLTRVSEDQALTSPDNRCSRFDLYEHRGYSEAEKKRADLIEDKYYSSSGSEKSFKAGSGKLNESTEHNLQTDEPLNSEERLVTINSDSKVGIGKSYLQPLSKSELSSNKQIRVTE